MTQPTRDPTVDLLGDALDRLALRAAVVSSNLANVETPGYRALQVEFEEQLALAREIELSHTARGHQGPGDRPSSRPILSEAPATRMRPDGNTVDLDGEMTRLSAVQGQYRAEAELVRKRFALLRYAAMDGRG